MQVQLTRKTKNEGRGLIVCALFILAIYAGLAAYFGTSMADSRKQSATTHRDRMDATKTDVAYPPRRSEFTEVKVGTYLENIRNLSIADSSFAADFYIWFSWHGDKELDPGELFQIVGGTIDSKELSSEHYLEEGSNYQRYKVSATIDKVFDTTRFSLEDHMLNIYIEDKKNDGAKINYVTDENSAISSRVKIPGFRVTQFQSTVKPHEYKSTFSSPNANGMNRVFSQYVIGISIARADLGFFLKVYFPYLLSVALGLVVLWTRSELIDARTGLGGASFFGVVANAYVVSTFVPANGGVFGLLDVLNVTSLVSVFLIVSASIASYNLFHRLDKPELSVALDRVVFFTVTFGYLCVSAVLLFSTYSNFVR
jgi:hypothetical protein